MKNSAFSKFSQVALLLSVMVHESVFAALPNIPTPQGGGIGGAQVQDGDWMGQMGAYFKAGISILALVLAGLSFIKVMGGGLRKWNEYSRGQAEFADLKEFFIVGVILIVFIVMMANYALSVLA
ncbi:integrating conjugative element membrane protein [Delftia sp. GW456-R20]|uniref:TIGR03745 family integrating conjugative element membrane protein n=1 Tax=Delftia sp. GW456-R20 TaxID=1827145 RepID=UPI0007AE73BE|nr:TIGR03745 family integrating conjugative element membrane protein [Delftia sp. GW456-R20]KZK27587.1 integrating conjugative element membrane protein [Delftia sp. GW456-R20]